MTLCLKAHDNNDEHKQFTELYLCCCRFTLALMMLTQIYIKMGWNLITVTTWH